MVHNRGQRHWTNMFPIGVRIFAERDKVAAKENADNALYVEQSLRERARPGLVDGCKIIRARCPSDFLTGQEFQCIWVWRGFGLNKHIAEASLLQPLTLGVSEPTKPTIQGIERRALFRRCRLSNRQGLIGLRLQGINELRRRGVHFGEVEHHRGRVVGQEATGTSLARNHQRIEVGSSAPCKDRTIARFARSAGINEVWLLNQRRHHQLRRNLRIGARRIDRLDIGT
mmetsp:Transcript_27363/g.35291  ORF Transcript_27363/g.35291 Transcript_27363/m.35291 type:complete len:228 (+) Transcript_27363:400-1083(+)